MCFRRKIDTCCCACSSCVRSSSILSLVKLHAGRRFGSLYLFEKIVLLEFRDSFRSLNLERKIDFILLCIFNGINPSARNLFGFLNRIAAFCGGVGGSITQMSLRGLCAPSRGHFKITSRNRARVHLAKTQQRNNSGRSVNFRHTASRPLHLHAHIMRHRTEQTATYGWFLGGTR